LHHNPRFAYFHEPFGPTSLGKLRRSIKELIRSSSLLTIISKRVCPIVSEFKSTRSLSMKKVIVLVMHGMPPRDFPKAEMGEYFRSYDPFHHVSSQGSGGHAHGGHGGDHGHGHAHGAPNGHSQQGPSRFQELDEKMKRWPRSPENDVFFGSAYKLAKQIEETSGCPVVVGFNEFCAPDLTEAISVAATHKPETIVVITPMMTPGGIHSEVDIPNTIKNAKSQYPNIAFEYVWPFNMANVARFLHEQIEERLSTKSST
jgi:sirohydrochlorin cobaltochelatase